MILYYLSSIIFLFFSMLCMIFSMMLLNLKLSYFLEWNVMIINTMNLNMFIFVDWVMMMFIFTVLLISSMILLYCCEYMYHDMNINRFFMLVYFFIMSMLLMIISPNMVSILIGWDGLGLISYCLVIYYQNYSSYNSGMLTILLNRIGDVTIMMSISLISSYGSWNYLFNNNYNKLILLMIIISAFTKSAQFPFSSWLPAAMAAPTPVSSLVHSSTLVTAGVYLLIRFHYLINKNLVITNIIIIVGLLTMMMAGFSANFEYDMKKIIAFSTLSQLGLMMMILGFKNWELSFFHLIIHAMFKSMMFMCSGILIHNMLNYQDIRYLGKMKFFMPMTFSMLIISNLSLCGMPFMSGFYSKDQILENMFLIYNNFIIYLFLLISTGLTVSYSMRMIYYLMNNNFNFMCMSMIQDIKLMNYPMIILMILSMFFGNLMNWIIINNIENIFLEFFEKIIIMIICIMFITIGKIMYMINNKFKYLYIIKYFFGKMWFLNYFNSMLIIIPLNFSKNYINYYDKGWSEMILKNSIMKLNMQIIWFDKFNNNNNIMFMLFNLSMLMLFILFLY